MSSPVIGSTCDLDCHTCNTNTVHALAFFDKKIRYAPYSPDDYAEEQEHWWASWSVYQCQGCRELVLQRVTNHSLSDHPKVEYFPECSKQSKSAYPDWSWSIARNYTKLLHQVYDSFAMKNYAIGTMGLRTLVDMLVVEQIGDVGTFEQKLAMVVTEGLLSPIQKDLLTPVIDLGNAAAHRGHMPSRQQVEAALDVVESLLKLFLLRKQVKSTLKEGVKKRRKRSKKSAAAKANTANSTRKSASKNADLIG